MSKITQILTRELERLREDDQREPRLNMLELLL